MRKVVGLINCLSPIPLTNNKLDDPCEMKAAITFGRQIKKEEEVKVIIEPHQPSLFPITLQVVNCNLCSDET